MKTAEQILDFELDPIPKYILMRDVLEIDKEREDMVELKKQVLESEMVTDIIKEQWSDGSWGKFHSMAELRQSEITTEQAIRRLIALGLDKDDEVIEKALIYMEFYLLKELELRDYKEKKYDWELLSRLFVATWLRIIDPYNVTAREVAEKWGKIVSFAFSGDKFDSQAYKQAYYEVHNTPKEKEILGIQNFYIVSILSGILSEEVEKKFIDYIISSNNGIYYICEDSLSKFPDDFYSKDAIRYINAYELISKYDYGKFVMKDFLKWLHNNICRDGFWDMGQKSKDTIHLPLSNTWRKPINRKIDCTIRLQRMLTQIRSYLENKKIV
ncbi:hypothetical protein [Natronospora cellulosivora (SeqCode)]